MSFTIHGIGVSSGVAIGHAHLVSHALLEVVQYEVPPHLIEQEVSRLEQAIETVKSDLYVIRNQLPEKSPAEIAAFINTHLMIVSDHSLFAETKKIIAHENCNAEWALKLHLESVTEQFDQIEDDYLRERKHDVMQVAERIIKILLGRPSQVPLLEQEKEIILVAHDISPADAIQFKHHHFAAFVTDVGGATSHTAILARSLNIPSIVALQRARALVKDGELLIVDGSQGVLIVNPDKDTLNEYLLKKEQWELEQQKLKRIKSNKPITLDGTQIELLANIEVPEDVEQVNAVGAGGIGLYRTEFLFMNRREMPTEQEQFDAYCKVAKAMQGKPITIRTLDIGADKEINPDTDRSCTNPALGLRAIRLCLAEPQLFHTQLRAILRASVFGHIKLLIPMLSSISELRQSILMINRAKKSLKEDGIPFDENIKIGGMIEIPAAAICAEAFAKELDFLSIGTNDLIQYSLAIDRTDDAVSHLYNPLHPAVLKLIEMTIRAGEKFKKEVSVCGEMAGDIKLTKLLMGLGLRHFSMHPSNILMVKRIILQSEVPSLKLMAKKMIQIDDPLKIEPFIKKMNQIQ
jgi:phosphoenolpyruvate-protein phosphotransferase (PTS system enzyme I)